VITQQITRTPHTRKDDAADREYLIVRAAHRFVELLVSVQSFYLGAQVGRQYSVLIPSD
jgi:hypothetical protein